MYILNSKAATKITKPLVIDKKGNKSDKRIHKKYLIKKNKGRKNKADNGQTGQIETNSKMLDLKLTISLVTLNVNGLNIHIKGSDCRTDRKSKS